MPDYEYQADLDLSAIKKKLFDASREFNKFAKQAETSLEKIQREAAETSQKVGGVGDSASKAGSKLKGAFGKLAGAAGVAAAVTGIAIAIKDLVGRAAELEKTQFNLASSVGAASEEFGESAGTLEDWKQTISEIRDEVKLFSEKELNAAVSRLVDMTKRLGLSQDLQEEILRRSLDVGAGKFSPEESIERVSAALRGEAESAEALGLTLSEGAVKAYAEEQGLLFDKMTDVEKAQLRTKLFLEQTEPVLGRAAALSKTLSGAEATRQAQMEDNLAVIGQQLIPVYDLWSRAIGLVATQSADGSGIITRALSVVFASVLTVANGFVTFTQSASSMLSTLSAGAEAIKAGKNPFTAMSAEMERTEAQGRAFGDFLKDIPGTFQELRVGLLDTWKEQRKAAEEAAGAVGGLTEVYGEAGEAAEEAAVSTEDYEKALQKIKDAHDDFNTDKARAEIDALVKAERAALDAALDAARKREDIAKKNLQKIADIAKKSEQDIADASKDLSRDEQDIATDAARAQVDVSRAAAQKRLDIETAYRRKLEDIQRQFAQSALDAERSRDAVAFLAAQRERDSAIAEAGSERGRGLADVGTEEGQAKEEARLDAERARQDAAVENERKMEDLRAQLSRELEEQRLANERDIEEARLAEERKRADLATAQEQEAADRATANARKLEDLNKSLAEENALVKQYEAQRNAIAQSASNQRISIAEREAARLKQIAAQLASGPRGTPNNPTFLNPDRPERRFGSIGHRAAGGDVDAGVPVWVGERGRELFTPPSDGYIHSNRAVSRVPAPAGSMLRNIDNSMRAQAEINLSDPTKLSAPQQKIVRNIFQTELQEFMRSQRRAGAR